MKLKYEEHMNDNNSICPYCKDEYQVESADVSEDLREIECDVCGMKYHLVQNITVTHITSPDCELNNMVHKFKKVELQYGEVEVCTICGITH